MRASIVTLVEASRLVSVKTCQIPARHADPSLTIGIYAKASLHDIHGAVESLPDLAQKSQAPEALRATGTDDSTVMGQSVTYSATGDPVMVSADSRNMIGLNGLRSEHGGELSVRDRRYDLWRGRKG